MILFGNRETTHIYLDGNITIEYLHIKVIFIAKEIAPYGDKEI